MPNLNRAEDDVFLMALEKWRDLHAGELHWDIEVVIDWMVENEEFGLERRIVRRELARKLARAQNKRHVRNAQGKIVKAYHSAMLPVNIGGKIVQKQLWGDRLIMSALFVRAAVEQRHKQTEGMCKAIHRTVEDVNENNPNLADNPIQLSFDFSYVTETRKQSKVERIHTDGPAPMPPARVEPNKRNKKAR